MTTLHTIELEIDKIVADDTVRTRACVDRETVRTYAREMDTGKKFPPLVVFSNGKTYWLSDGFHRVEAAKMAGRDKIKAEVRKGTRRDAIKFGFKANDRHGLRRTNGDKRYAVGLAIKEFGTLSSNAIAELCGVDHQLVAKVRRQLGDSPSSTIGRDGKTRRVKPTSTPEPMSKPAAAAAAEQATPSDKADPTPLVVSAEAPASPVQEQPMPEQIQEPVDRQAAVQAPAVVDLPVQLGDNAVEVPATPHAVIIPAGGEEVDFVLADGTSRRVPWFHNRLLTFKAVDVHVKETKSHYESKTPPTYDQPTIVRFQNALISSASLAVSLLGTKPTPTDHEIARRAMEDIRGMIPDPLPFPSSDSRGFSSHRW